MLGVDLAGLVLDRKDDIVLDARPGQQRRLLEHDADVVARFGDGQGRDIGTVVLPDAEVKVFLVASLAERVRRRREELAATGTAPLFEDLARDIAERDARDAARDVAPMVPAPDAVTLDSDGLDADAVAARILALCAEVENNGR